MSARPTRQLLIERECRAWAARCAGQSMAAIAVELGVTARAVSYMLERIEARELARLGLSVEQVKAREFDRLARVLELKTRELTRLTGELERLRGTVPDPPAMSAEISAAPGARAEEMAARDRAYERRGD